MKLLSFCNVRRVKRCPGRDLLIAALPDGYLVKNGVRHACRTAVSGNLCRVRATLFGLSLCRSMRRVCMGA